MIDKQIVERVVSGCLNDSEFVVEVTVTPSNKIGVTIDSDNGITIDRCVMVSRAIEQELDREQEDFELEVASAGLSEPMRLPRQYKKNIGRTISVVTLNGEKYKGTLTDANDLQFCVEFEEKVLVDGKKRKQLVTKKVDLLYTDVKSTKIEVTFR